MIIVAFSHWRHAAVWSCRFARFPLCLFHGIPAELLKTPPQPPCHPMRRTISLISAALAAAVFAGAVSCTSQPADAPVAPRAAPAPAAPGKTRLRISPAKLARAVHDRINRDRRRQGLPTFRWDAALGRIAGKHSRDMARRKFFGHTSPDGTGPAQRYLQARYACGITVDGVLRSGAEVIYRHAPDNAERAVTGGVQSAGDIIGAAIEAWMRSEEDRTNVLSPHWQREGVGIFMTPDGAVYMTVNFC